MGKERRRSERVETSWDQSIRLYLKNGGGPLEKHQVTLLNCSETGVCVEVPAEAPAAEVDDRLSLLFQVGEETSAFVGTVKWVRARTSDGTGRPVRCYGARIEPGTATNPGLFRRYVYHRLIRERAG